MFNFKINPKLKKFKKYFEFIIQLLQEGPI